MSSYADKLKKIGEASWKKSKTQDFSNLSEGRYVTVITAARFDEIKKGKQAGNPVIRVQFKVQTGPFKNRQTSKTYWIASINKKDGSSVGFSQLKGDCEKLGIDLPAEFSEKKLQEVFKKMVNSVCEIVIIEKGGFSNIYINRAVNAPDAEEVEETEEEETETEEETEEEETEEEAEEEADEEEDAEEDEDEEEEEEEAPPPKKKTAKKEPAAKKPAMKVKADEEEDDDEMWDDL